MNTQKSNKLPIENLKKKKSKHGKKNWRKNIDISEIEKKEVEKNQEKLLEKNVSNLKDEDLFVIDSAPVDKLQKKYLNKKTQRTEKKPKKKLSKFEERLIKRKQKSLVENKEEKKEEKPQIKNLWDDEETTTTKICYPVNSLKFPKVPLPHPGQSYNPSREDLSNLLHKIVEHNKKKVLPDESNAIEKLEEQIFESESESENEEKKLKNTNNDPVDDFTQRKTKKEKKRNIQKKLNLIKEREIINRKQNKIILANEKSLKRIEKERLTKLKEEEEKKKALLEKVKEKEDLKKIGIVEDPELLTDFHVKKEPIPLRKMKTKANIISERFENILKRNAIGEYSNSNTKNKRNRKLNKMKVRDGFGEDYGYELNDDNKKLKIFE